MQASRGFESHPIRHNARGPYLTTQGKFHEATVTGILSGKNIVVCGGSSGIGFATASHLRDLGADISLAARTPEKLEAAANKLGGEVPIAAVDFASADASRDYFRKLEPLDHVVISLAGNAAMGPFSDLDVAGYRDTFEGKFWPYVNAMHEAANVLEPDGSVTIVTGASALAATPGASSLSAVNGALEGMIKTLAVELAPRRINAASPGLTDTEAWLRIPDDIRAQMYAAAAEKTPMGRIGQAEDVARLVGAFITNDFLTGLVVPCDGGNRLA